MTYVKTKSTRKISKTEINKILRKLKTRKLTSMKEIYKIVNEIILNRQKKFLIKDNLF